MKHRVATRPSSIVRAVAALACPVMLSGCIFGFPFAPLPQRPPSPAPSVAALPSPTTQAQIPDLPIRAIADAPGLAIWAPLANARIRVSTWRAGSIATLIDLPLLNHNPVFLDHVRVSVAPTGRFVAVVEPADEPSPSRAFVRIFSIAGDLVWTATGDVTSHPTVRWSQDGSRAALDARNRWLVVTMGDGPASEVDIDARRAVPAGGGDYPWGLLGFSEDGKTLLGTSAAGLPPGSFPIAIAPVSGGAIAPLGALPTGKGQRLAAWRQLGEPSPAAPIDPETGRVATFSSSGTSADVAIDIRSGEKTRTFSLPGSGNGPVDMVWQAGGSLLILHDGPDPATQRLGVLSTGSDLGVERPVTSIPIVGLRGRLLASSDGFAILAFGGQFLESPRRLLLIRLRDGAETLVDADGATATTETFGFAGWLPTAGGALAADAP